MGSAKLIIAAVFALTLSSGVVTGLLVSHLPVKTPMEQALGLNPDQQQKMQQIWEHVRDMTDDCYLQAQELQEKQWKALVDMLTPEQKAAFSKQDAKFKADFDDLKKRREAAFQKAVSDTDALLDPAQQKRFHDLIKTRVGRSLGETPPWLSPGGGGSGQEPATHKAP
jgi:hypothetical protein